FVAAISPRCRLVEIDGGVEQEMLGISAGLINGGPSRSLSPGVKPLIRAKLPSSRVWGQYEDHVSVTVNRAASDTARLSSAASFGSVTVSRGRPCSSRSRHS